MMKRVKSKRRFENGIVLFVVSIILFMGGIAVGLLGRVVCTRSNDNYEELQPESFVPDTIETVLHDERLKQLYVCYNDANCVNVYTEEGTFLWCVATPYLRNSGFVLQDGKLIIYDSEAYVYDSENGSFLGIEQEENLDLNHNRQNEFADHYEEGSFYFDSFQVYKTLADGTLEVVVSRPWWNFIFHYWLALGISGLGAVGIGISIFAEKRRDYNAVKKSVVLRRKKTRFLYRYFKITTFVHLIYTVLNILCAFFAEWLILGIIPLTLHMIVSNIILWNIKDRLSWESEELYVIDFWGVSEIGSFIFAFVSVIVASGIAG